MLKRELLKYLLANVKERLMNYRDYLSGFSSKDEVVQDIKENMTNSKEFVNIFLGYTNNKCDEDKNKLFNEVVDKMAQMIVDSEK